MNRKYDPNLYKLYEPINQRDLELMYNGGFKGAYDEKHQSSYRGRKLKQLQKNIENERDRILNLNREANYWNSTFNSNYKPNNENIMMKQINTLSDYVDHIANKALDNGMPKFISKIHPEISFKYNSYNIYCGKPGSSKTTFVMKQFMKLSLVKNDYHLIIYVAGTDSDDTVNSLSQFINIPIMKTTYDKIEDQFNKLIDLKENIT